MQIDSIPTMLTSPAHSWIDVILSLPLISLLAVWAATLLFFLWRANSADSHSNL
jgi:hypothetical protein